MQPNWLRFRHNSVSPLDDTGFVCSHTAEQVIHSRSRAEVVSACNDLLTCARMLEVRSPQCNIYSYQRLIPVSFQNGELRPGVSIHREAKMETRLLTDPDYKVVAISFSHVPVDSISKGQVRHPPQARVVLGNVYHACSHDHSNLLNQKQTQASSCSMPSL